MISSLAYYPILGKPLMFYLGIMTVTLLIITATMGYLVTKGKVKFTYHRFFAFLTLISAGIHALLGILYYL